MVVLVLILAVSIHTTFDLYYLYLIPLCRVQKSLQKFFSSCPHCELQCWNSQCLALSSEPGTAQLWLIWVRFSFPKEQGWEQPQHHELGVGNVTEPVPAVTWAGPAAQQSGSVSFPPVSGFHVFPEAAFPPYINSIWTKGCCACPLSVVLQCRDTKP